MTEWTEANVTINGTQLTFAEAMTLRVALSDFMMGIATPDALGSDETGRGIRDGYQKCGSNILRLMINGRIR